MKKTPIVILCVAILFAGGFFYFKTSNAETAAKADRFSQKEKPADHPAAPAKRTNDSSPDPAENSPAPAIAGNDPVPPTSSPASRDSWDSQSNPGDATASQNNKPNDNSATYNDASSAPVEVAQLLQGVDLSDPAARAEVVAQMTRNEESRMDAVLEKAGRLGIPVRIDGPDGKVSILHSFRGDEPLYRTTNNKNAAISTAANLVQSAPYSLDGTGVKVGVWDGGSIRGTHRELAGRVAIKNASAAADDHATHVAGTIGGGGADPNAKGMAPKASIDSYDWDNDYAEMTAVGAAVPGDLAAVTVSNHSYGYNAATQDMGRYETEARSVDALAIAMPFYLPFWAAGNEQDSLTALGGYQSITFNSVAKNIMVVGAVNDAVVAGVRSPSAGTMTTFSSWGPCDDGRIKPDLVANGASVYSSTAASDSAYDTYSGTSMASPNAAGSASLLQQLYAKNFNQRLRASMLKALLIHTTDDLGNPGPDYKFGWGLINTKSAADLILAQKSNPSAPKLLEGTLTPAVKSVSTTLAWDGVSPIRATLSWTDPAGVAQSLADSRTPNIIHDLDMKITGPDGATTYLPFVMPFVGTWTAASMSAAAVTGKNKTDNVEQVRIPAPNRAGSYTFTVSMDGQLTTAAQPYALVVTGMAGAGGPSPTPTPAPSPTPTPSPSPSPSPTPTPSNPAPTVAISAPLNGAGFALGSPITISATASDLTSSGSAGVVSRLEFFNGTSSLGVDSTAPYSISWTPSVAGNYTIQARATDSQGAVGTSASVGIRVIAPAPAPIISGFSPASGPVGTTVIISGSNFTGVTGIQFNGTPATVWTIVSSSQISVVVPGGATTGPVRLTTAGTSVTSSASFTITAPAAGTVVISQIYAGGGRWWSDYSNDYVELYNSGSAPVSLAGWSLQFAGGTGNVWSVLPLRGSIPAKGFYLVALASGEYAYDLPVADASGSVDLATKQGKIALMRSTTPLTIASPVGLASASDFVGYGMADVWEGSYPAVAPDRWFAIFRGNGGSLDTNDNYWDFDWDYPAPRNSKSPATLMIKRKK